MNMQDLEASLIQSAPANDRHGGTLSSELSLLAAEGFNLAPLSAAHGGQGWACNPDRVCDGFHFLRMLGRANLSLGRLFEGHWNAVKLVELYGTPDQTEAVARKIANGQWLGVWGAEGPEPVTCNNNVLDGAKRFASGIGNIDIAVVPVGAGEQCQLYIAPCDDRDRGDVSRWNVSGMRATRSGTYDFTGVEAQDLGKPGDYQREPWFEGGVWRYCAVHLGGAEAMRDDAVAIVTRRGHADAPRQRDRIARMAMLCETMRLWVLEAATRVEGSDGNENVTSVSASASAAYALLAREQTELGCLEVMMLADRAIGTAGHGDGCRADRIRRDLGLFLRQADIDGKMDRAAQALLAVQGRADAL